VTAPNRATAYRDAVWDDAALSVVQKMVALCYANHAQGGDLAWVTYVRLMQQTGIRSKETAAAAIKALVAVGWLRPVGAVPGHRQIILYRLEIPTGTEPVRKSAKPVRLRAETGTATVLNPLYPLDPQGEPPPPAQCDQHLDRPAPGPCGRCRDARLARGRWDAEQHARIAAAPKCPRHRGELAHNCGPCRGEALAGGPPAAAAALAVDRPPEASPDRTRAQVADEIAAVDGDNDAQWVHALGVVVEDLLHLPPAPPAPDDPDPGGAKILAFRSRTHAS
jgi:hypothetical protein